jgi:UDP-glucose 6-dehydrogenase
MEFQIVTTGSFRRVYTVQADDEDHARKRMRQHVSDPESLREGLVVQDDAQARYVAGEQISTVTVVGAPADPKEGGKDGS